ncbi:MAG TPA: hypothetical protein DCZ94_21935 [Lentisphaeria bacterium]|nr:MAG: hypothetical protein A2X48_19225 [Lentisphaerae bacterium GWF2_49_21]HBC89607.1 hypothetical protein [Lentisphaeria bacterium]
MRKLCYLCCIFAILFCFRTAGVEEKDAGGLWGGASKSVEFKSSMENSFEMSGHAVDDWKIIGAWMEKVGPGGEWISEYSTGLKYAKAKGTVGNYKQAPTLFPATLKGKIVKGEGNGPVPTFTIDGHCNLYRIFPETADIVWNQDTGVVFAAFVFNDYNNIQWQSSDWLVSGMGVAKTASGKAELSFGPNSDVYLEHGGQYTVTGRSRSNPSEHYDISVLTIYKILFTEHYGLISKWEELNGYDVLAHTAFTGDSYKKDSVTWSVSEGSDYVTVDAKGVISLKTDHPPFEDLGNIVITASSKEKYEAKDDFTIDLAELRVKIDGICEIKNTIDWNNKLYRKYLYRDINLPKTFGCLDKNAEIRFTCHPENYPDELPFKLYLKDEGNRTVEIYSDTIAGGENIYKIPRRIVDRCQYYSLIAEWGDSKDEWNKDNAKEKFWLIAGPNGGLKLNYTDVKGAAFDLQKWMEGSKFYIEFMKMVSNKLDSDLGKYLSWMINFSEKIEFKGSYDEFVIHNIKAEHNCKVHRHDTMPVICESHKNNWAIKSEAGKDIIDKKADAMKYLADAIMKACKLDLIPDTPPGIPLPDIKGDIGAFLSEALKKTSGITAEGELLVRIEGDVKYSQFAHHYPCYDVSKYLGTNLENIRKNGDASIGENSQASVVISFDEFWSKKFGEKMTYKDALIEILRVIPADLELEVPMKFTLAASGDVKGYWKADFERKYLNMTDANGRSFELGHVNSKTGLRYNLYDYGAYHYLIIEKKNSIIKEVEKDKYLGEYLDKNLKFVEITEKLTKEDLKKLDFEKVFEATRTPYAKLEYIGEEE